MFVNSQLVRLLDRPLGHLLILVLMDHTQEYPTP